MSSISGHNPVQRQEARQQQADTGSGDRLWQGLARPRTRPLPPQGLDIGAVYIRGVIERLRHRRSVLRRRARRVITLAAKLETASEAAFDDAIGDARRAAILGRDHPASIELAFSVAYEAVRRTIGLSLYEEQVMGALAMASGCLAEMATGEGKTLTAILPAALDGWTGRGLHVITVNDYLARRDAEITSPAYKRLGLTVGILQDDSEPGDRREAYDADITYSDDKQVIFDHLRDRLMAPLAPSLTEHLLDQMLADAPSQRGQGENWSSRVVQRSLNAAIIDEADSVLIDEAVTPAIIALPVPADDGTPAGGEHYQLAARLARDLRSGEHYRADRRMRLVELTDTGRDRLAQLAPDLPAFWAGPRRREELITQALTAKELYTRDDEYIVRDKTDDEGKTTREIAIVDPSTGRVLDGRQWQLGLHQAVEAKEGIDLTDTRRTSARVSYQRFFQSYARLSGMTGTAWEVRNELWRDDHLPVVRIPTHRPIIRKQRQDIVCRDADAKFRRVADRVESFHAEGRPVLIGTRSVESSERLGALLAERNVPCRILNAVRESEEADIVARAGEENAVTVATNMAGRGTDIILSPKTRQLGGLVVIATERHSERRVDRQLYGRSGRQGDPGLALTYVALDDDLVARTGSKTLLRLTRAFAGPLRKPLAWITWTFAQHAASRRAAATRKQSMQYDAWLDVSMHHETR